MKRTVLEPALPLPDGSEVVHVVGAAILQGGVCLVARRKAGGTGGGKWEFPGGKVEAGETPQRALEREIEEEFGEAISVEGWVGRGIAQHETRRIVLDVYRASPKDRWEGRGNNAHDEIRWVEAHELSDFDWAEADIPIVPRVEELLQGRQRSPLSSDNG